MGAFILGKSKKNPASARPKISISPWDLCWRPCFAHENLWGHRVWNTHQDQSLPLQPINLSMENTRRKFRSQISDNMDRGKSKGGKSQRREDQRWERVTRKKIQVREKVEKSRFTAFFQWFVSPEGRKVGSLKRRVRSHLARWEMKNCTPLWREAHSKVKMCKTHHSRTTFGSWDVEKVHAIVARSTFRSQKC